MKREIDLTETTEERLRREIDDLKRQLREQKSPGSSHVGLTAKPWQPSSTTLWSICLGVIVLIVIGFLAGYIPLQRRQNLIRNQALEQEQALPRMEVIEVGASSPKSELELPGNIQAITEAPILARANGYIKQRMVDIGDRVTAGQPMAEIEAPEVDQQMSRAKASLEQARAALEQSLANYEQGKSNLDLARVTAERWNALEKEGIVPKQENDQYQAQYQAQTAGVQALGKAVSAQRSNVAAAEASLAALDQVQSYRVVKAPFDGLVTLRNVDVGTLVNGGNTLLFRVAQTSTLRTYVNVPQADSGSASHSPSPRRGTFTPLSSVGSCGSSPHFLKLPLVPCSKNRGAASQASMLDRQCARSRGYSSVISNASSISVLSRSFRTLAVIPTGAPNNASA